jgi:hypothetical protein
MSNILLLTTWESGFFDAATIFGLWKKIISVVSG